MTKYSLVFLRPTAIISKFIGFSLIIIIMCTIEDAPYWLCHVSVIDYIGIV